MAASSGDLPTGNAIHEGDIIPSMAQVEPTGLPLHHALEAIMGAEREFVDSLDLNAHAYQCDGPRTGYPCRSDTEDVGAFYRSRHRVPPARFPGAMFDRR